MSLNKKSPPALTREPYKHPNFTNLEQEKQHIKQLLSDRFDSVVPALFPNINRG